jgi:arylsulfatase
MATSAKKNPKQPNILVIWGDDIGISNLSCYSHG